jgi:hypothetical protein
MASDGQYAEGTASWTEVSADEPWWSTKRANAETGLSRETFRKWAGLGRVRSRRQRVGQRTLIEVNAEDVVREAALVRRYSGTAPRPQVVAAPLADADVRARIVVLEEVARRQRIIDEHRQVIELAHGEIEREQREIAELLLGPASVPNR